MSNPTTFEAAGYYTKLDGSPQTGKVTFLAAQRESNEDAVQNIRPREVLISRDGYVVQTLVENAFGYFVVEQPTDGPHARYWIPGDQGDIDLAAVDTTIGIPPAGLPIAPKRPVPCSLARPRPWRTGSAAKPNSPTLTG